MMRRAMVVVFGLGCLLTPTGLFAGELPSRYTLGRCVPGDWWMYMHFAKNPEAAWIEANWAKVFDAFKQSGITEDAFALILDLAGDKKRADVENMVGKIKEMLAGVRWGALVEEEVVVAERIEPPMPYYLVLCRGAAGSATGNAEGLATILKYLASLSDKLSVAQDRRMGAVVWTLRLGGDAPYAVHLFQKDDLVGLAVVAPQPEVFDQILNLMAGEKSVPPLIETPRFRKALASVPSPEDGLMFFDYERLMRGVGGMVNMGVQKACHRAEKDQGGVPEARRWGEALVSGIEMANVLDYGVVSIETHGRQQRTHSVNVFQEGKMSSPITRMFLNRKPFAKFDHFIPADATGFSLTGFMDVELAYDTVLEFAEHKVPDGKEYVAKWKEWLGGTGFDPKRDVFSWWSGEMINISLPPAVPSPMSTSDSVLMIRVKNHALAREKLETALTFCKNLAAKANQQLMVTPDPEGLKGFWQITHPMMVMFLRPVVGVAEDWLVLSTSPAAVRKCLAVAAGEAPSIRKNERFAEEGLAPDGPALSVSFQDTSNIGREIGQALAMANMMGGMIAAGMAQNMPDDPDAKKAQGAITKVFGMLGRLGPVVAKVDFYSSEASLCTVEGRVLRTKDIVTYKPSAMEVKTAAADPMAK